MFFLFVCFDFLWYLSLTFMIITGVFQESHPLFNCNWFKSFNNNWPKIFGTFHFLCDKNAGLGSLEFGASSKLKGSLFLMDTFSKSCALSLYWIYLMLIHFSVFFHKSLESWGWLIITVLELHEYVVLMMVVVVLAMIMIDSWKCWWFTAPDMDFRISPLDF